MFEVSPQPGTQKELVRTRALYWHSIPLCPKGTYLKKPMTRPLRHCRQINACGLLHPSTNGRSGIAAAQTETESGRKPTPCSGHISFLRPGRGLDCILTWILLCGLGPKRKGTCFLLHQGSHCTPPPPKKKNSEVHLRVFLPASPSPFATAPPHAGFLICAHKRAPPNQVTWRTQGESWQPHSSNPKRHITTHRPRPQPCK